MAGSSPATLPLGPTAQNFGAVDGVSHSTRACLVADARSSVEESPSSLHSSSPPFSFSPSSSSPSSLSSFSSSIGSYAAAHSHSTHCLALLQRLANYLPIVFLQGNTKLALLPLPNAGVAYCPGTTSPTYSCPHPCHSSGTSNPTHHSCT